MHSTQDMPGSRAADALYARIFEDITSGRLAVGDRLPTEMDLAETEGVSRVVVREALLRLRVDGLVTSRQGAGTFVSHQPAQRITRFASATDVAAFLRCLELRETLEGDAARLAAQRASPEELAAIAAAHDAFAEVARTGRLPVAEDLAFHAAIGAATGNDFYTRALEGVHESITGFMQLSLSLSSTTPGRERIRQVLDEHAAIRDAVLQGDGERSRVAMLFHLGQARRRVVDRNRDAG